MVSAENPCYYCEAEDFEKVYILMNLYHVFFEAIDFEMSVVYNGIFHYMCVCVCVCARACDLVAST